MAIRGDSYGSTTEVKAFTRYLLDGQSAFNSTTTPTATEVEKFIDRASGILNLALRKRGFAVPITNSTAKLSCDDWVVDKAVQYVELTQRGAGFSAEEGTRVGGFAAMQKDAAEFAMGNELGFKRLGVTVSEASSQALTFTGLTVQKDRTDPDDNTLEQPVFRRRQFEDVRTNRFADEDDENA